MTQNSCSPKCVDVAIIWYYCILSVTNPSNEELATMCLLCVEFICPGLSILTARKFVEPEIVVAHGEEENGRYQKAHGLISDVPALW
uniref:Uncharacterized protein n=1 Tax=Oryza brachyantha TaxID=4533 RepID=J3NCW3_ORYBR